MTIVRVTVKRRIVIPAPIRKKYHITKGVEVGIEDTGSVILIKPLLRGPIKEAKGMFKGGKSALKVLLSERTKESMTSYFVDPVEMAQIKTDKKLLGKLKAGHSDVKKMKGRFMLSADNRADAY